jgi:hypothetical protein
MRKGFWCGYMLEKSILKNFRILKVKLRKSDKKYVLEFDKELLEIKLQKTTASFIEDSLSNISKLINTRTCTTCPSKSDAYVNLIGR